MNNFGARYYGVAPGRFITPDDFLKDSDVRDPQSWNSWNKYAYVRNNPLRYIDPTGEEATVSQSCTTDSSAQKTCQVSITASIAIYGINGITGDQLKQAQTAITSNLDEALSGSFTKDGVNYNVTTNVTVSIVDSKDAGIKSGAQNVIEIDTPTGPKSQIDPNPGRSYDTGTFRFDQVKDGAIIRHDGTHILGLDDNHGEILSDAHSVYSMRLHSRMTAEEFQWVLGQGKGQKFNVGQKHSTDIFGNAAGNRHWWEGYLSR